MKQIMSALVKALALVVFLTAQPVAVSGEPTCCEPWEGGNGCCVNSCNEFCLVDQGGFVLEAVCGGPPYWCSLYCYCSCHRPDIGLVADFVPTDDEDTPCALCDGGGGTTCPGI